MLDVCVIINIIIIKFIKFNIAIHVQITPPQGLYSVTAQDKRLQAINEHSQAGLARAKSEILDYADIDKRVYLKNTQRGRWWLSWRRLRWASSWWTWREGSQ